MTGRPPQTSTPISGGSAVTPTDETQIDRALSDAEAKLDEARVELLFSNTGFSKYKESIRDFARDLLAGATAIARRNNADQISGSYVEQARDALVARPRKRLIVFLGELGAIAVGLSTTGFYDLIKTHQLDVAVLIASLAMLVIGLVAMLWALFAE